MRKTEHQKIVRAIHKRHKTELQILQDDKLRIETAYDEVSQRHDKLLSVLEYAVTVCPDIESMLD